MDRQDQIDHLEEQATNSTGNTRKLFQQRARLLRWAEEKRKASDLEKNVRDTLL